MKKISEMSLEELQDYALNLEQQRAADLEKEQEHVDKIAELTEINLQLQRRNNNLLMQVEQTIPGKDEPKSGEKIESCEDFAARIAKEI